MRFLIDIDCISILTSPHSAIISSKIVLLLSRWPYLLNDRYGKGVNVRLSQIGLLIIPILLLVQLAIGLVRQKVGWSLALEILVCLRHLLFD